MKKYSIKDLVNKIQNKEISCEEVIDFYIKEIEKKEDKIDAFLSLDKENAIKKAKYLDEKIVKGEKVGLLAGIPIAIKDNMCTRGVKTTCASKMLEDFIPPYDATVIKKLELEDAILIGKTNLDEFAMGSRRFFRRFCCSCWGRNGASSFRLRYRRFN